MTELFKKKEQTIRVDATQEQTIDTEAVFYSHDKGTAKFLFHLLRKDKKKIPVILEEGTSVLICLLFQAADEADPLGRHIYQATIEEAESGVVSWLLPDQVLGYQGEVQGSIYLELPNQQSLDTAGRFTFTMKRSPIDEEVPKFISYYYDGFDGLEERLQATLTKVEQIEASLAENAMVLAQAEKILPQVTELKEQLTAVENQTATAQSKATEIQESLSDTKLVATAEKNGLMPAGDKAKLDGIEVGAQKNPGVVSWDKDGLMDRFDKIALDNFKGIGYPTPFKDVNAPLWDFPNGVSMFTIDAVVAEELEINPTSLTYPNHMYSSQVVTYNSMYQGTQWSIPPDVTKDPIWIRSSLFPDNQFDPDAKFWTEWVKLNGADSKISNQKAVKFIPKVPAITLPKDYPLGTTVFNLWENDAILGYPGSNGGYVVTKVMELDDDDISILNESTPPHRFQVEVPKKGSALFATQWEYPSLSSMGNLNTPDANMFYRVFDPAEAVWSPWVKVNAMPI
ncbi:TPA: BppU family phage baseplate upper protein [Enterococcus faecalis]